MAKHLQATTMINILMEMKQRRWTDEETRRLKALWESEASVDEILAEFPDRTLNSIQNKAVRERFRRP